MTWDWGIFVAGIVTGMGLSALVLIFFEIRYCRKPTDDHLTGGTEDVR